LNKVGTGDKDAHLEGGPYHDDDDDDDKEEEEEEEEEIREKCY